MLFLLLFSQYIFIFGRYTKKVKVEKVKIKKIFFFLSRERHVAGDFQIDHIPKERRHSLNGVQGFVAIFFLKTGPLFYSDR